ncbi:type IV secretion system protein [uncultured Fibrella sp.]|uniref:type IV secretion system protein n=1 Tax=uncultured Fibrella sp. TaxID=1284596 RepID=UPI0035C9969C
MEEYFNLLDELQTIYSEVLKDSTSTAREIETMIRSAAGIGALLYIFSRLAGQISRNEPIDFFPYLRPFAMVILLTAAPKICDSLDAFGLAAANKITGGNQLIYQRVKKQSELIREKVKEKWDKIGSDPKAYSDYYKSNREADEGGFFGDTKVEMKIAFDGGVDKFYSMLLGLIQDFLLAVMHVCESLMYLISISYRLILRFGAPIAIVMAIFPGFTSNLAEWFGKYINYALLPMVAALYGRIAFTVSDKYLAKYSGAIAITQGGAEADNVTFLGVAYIAILFMLIIGYFQVPSMTNMLVTVGGVGAMVQGATRIGSQLASQTSRKGGAAVGTAAQAGAHVGGSVLRGTSGSFGKSFGIGMSRGEGGSPNSSGGTNHAPAPTFSVPNSPYRQPASGGFADRSRGGQSGGSAAPSSDNSVPSADAPRSASGRSGVKPQFSGSAYRGVAAGVRTGGKVGARVGDFLDKQGPNTGTVGARVGRTAGAVIGGGLMASTEVAKFGLGAIGGTAAALVGADKRYRKRRSV